MIGRRLLRLGEAVRVQVAVTTLLALAAVAANVAQALIIAHLLVSAFRGRYAPSPALLVGLAVVVAGRFVVVRAQEVRATTTALALRKDLRTRLYAKLAELGPAYLLRHRTGTVQSTVLDGVDAVGGYFGRFLPLLIAASATGLVVVAVIGALDPITGAAVLACALLVPAAPIVTERAFGETARKFWGGFGQLSAGYLDAIQGMNTLRAFNAQRRWGARLLDESQDLCEDAIGLNALASMHVGFVALGMAAGTAGAVALTALRVTQGAVGLTAGLTILLLARECFRPLAELSAALPQAYVAVSASTGVIELLDADAAVVDPAIPVVIDRQGLVPSLAFEDVIFSYRPDRPDRPGRPGRPENRPAVDRLTFHVDAGETVALVGRSGAGKTTVVSLLMRFFDPQSGHIRLGGHDISELAVAQLRDLIAVCFQDTYLFHRSIRDNLLFGRPDASDADMEAAARAAHAHGFIHQLPEGYDTVVGERGVRLSGGERQRIAIARALLADRPILVLDEPTSSVDGESEVLIKHALERLSASRTTLIIAHRLSTIEGADRVVVLESGRVVESGSPAELMAVGGAYSRLVQAQELK